MRLRACPANAAGRRSMPFSYPDLEQCLGDRPGLPVSVCRCPCQAGLGLGVVEGGERNGGAPANGGPVGEGREHRRQAARCPEGSERSDRRLPTERIWVGCGQSLERADGRVDAELAEREGRCLRHARVVVDELGEQRRSHGFRRLAPSVPGQLLGCSPSDVGVVVGERGQLVLGAKSSSTGEVREGGRSQRWVVIAERLLEHAQALWRGRVGQCERGPSASQIGHAGGSGRLGARFGHVPMLAALKGIW